uniref:Uncharacterized protein n=1 Tax=Rhizophora mucronata TaxID=61149 RepID=A0A2P2PBT2_RHIMU
MPRTLSTTVNIFLFIIFLNAFLWCICNMVDAFLGCSCNMVVTNQS